MNQGTVEAPTPIIHGAWNRLCKSANALDGQIVALREKLEPVISSSVNKVHQEATPSAYADVPFAKEMELLSETLEQYYCKLDELLQQIEL